MMARLGLVSLLVSLLCAGSLREARAQDLPRLRFEVDQLRVELPAGALNENFDPQPLQSNTPTGVEEPTVVILNALGEQIASVTGPFSAAGIAAVAGAGRVLVIESDCVAGNGFVAVADLPGLDESIPHAGSGTSAFAVLLDANRPDFSAGFRLRASVREATGCTGTEVRFLIGEVEDPNGPEEGAEFVSRRFPLSTTFQTDLTVTQDDLSPIEGGPSQIDLTKIRFVSLEFFTVQGSLPVGFEVDEVRIDLPTASLLDGFDSYPVQSSTATGPAGDQVAIVLNLAGQAIASVSEGGVSSAGISDLDGGGRALTITVESGAESFLTILDLPAFEPSLTIGGPFAVLRSEGRPDFSSGFSFSARVRETSGSSATVVRFNIFDAGTSGVPDSEVEWVTASFSLSTSFQIFTVAKEDFGPVPNESGTIDFARIAGVGLEFFRNTVDQCLAGDADGDGDIDILDSALVRRFLAGFPLP